MRAVSAASKPVPVADELSSGFWEASADGILAMQRCGSCGWLAYPPGLVCISCRADPPRFSWEPVSGQGRLKTWTVMRDSFLPGFDDDIPYVVADVELVEQPGLRMVARLRGIGLDELVTSMPLVVAFGDPVDGMRVPHFVRGAS